MRKEAPPFFSPENRGKLQHQLQFAQALYLDAYCNPESSKWYIDPKGASRVDRLGANAGFALTASDGYVWIYGERGYWWPNAMKFPKWDERLPGVKRVLAQAKARANSTDADDGGGVTP
jgi:hypothetical protein